MIKIGHRGARGYEPENTLRSFKKALELGVDAVEFDVHICKSGEIVVIHDEKVDRTTNGKGFVAEKTFSELRKLDAGKGEKIPSLNEVLDLINRKVKANIELKGHGAERPVLDLIDEYVKKKNWKYSDFLISSFEYIWLEEVRKINPRINIGVLIEKNLNHGLRVAEMINAYSVNPDLKLVNKKFVENMHEKGMKVFVWTVNKKEDIEKMKSFGVDGIFSDYPNRI
jgi:glycerophosphoryl diester phosphodiesterase